MVLLEIPSLSNYNHCGADAQHVGDDFVHGGADLAAVVAVEGSGDVVAGDTVAAPDGFEAVEGIEAFQRRQPIPVDRTHRSHRGIQ